MEDEVGKKGLQYLGLCVMVWKTGLSANLNYYEVIPTIINFRPLPANEKVEKNYVIQDQ